MADMDDDDLLEALGVEAAPNKAGTHTAKQERLIAGFEEIGRASCRERVSSPG